jgi:hypothetical protein
MTAQYSVGAGMELWITRQRGDRDKTSGRFTQLFPELVPNERASRREL